MKNRADKLYIQLYNIHGLIRGENLELGRDADTGGQTKYVLELAKELSKRKEFLRVEIVTRWINDKNISKDYSIPIEKVNDKLRIVRIRCGGGKYIRKELLWDYLEEFVDRSIRYLKTVGRLPDVIHSHYADAGFVCTELSKFFGIPFIHTGHSLGRLKLQGLLENNLSMEEIEKKFRISHRISVEENAIFYANKIITSTNHEIENQYSAYKNAVREKFKVVPPGIELKKFYPFNEKRERTKDAEKVRAGIRAELWKFFMNFDKPIILMLCRPEKRKNIAGLIEAYGKDKELQEIANLAIYAGIRKDIQSMSEIEKDVLTEMLLLMDKFDLYGKMAIPKKHDVEDEVPELYRISAESGGVFVNPAFNENFGLTLIEAAMSGLPVVATNRGGPQDIIGNLKDGLLVDVSDPTNISETIKKVIKNKKLWNRFSESGVELVTKYYGWDSHISLYIKEVVKLKKEYRSEINTFGKFGKKLLECEKLIIVDIDNTLLGDTEALERFKLALSSQSKSIGFGVATGRTIDSAIQVLEENNAPKAEIIISSVGTELYYKDKENYIYSTGWDKHLSASWERETIIELLSDFDFLEYQEKENQRKYKMSYYLRGDIGKIKLVREKLIRNRIKCNLVFSHDEFVDIIPFRASKGRAVRYLAYRWNISLNNVLVAGDSGNDEDMLIGEMLGVIVGNYSPELEKIKGKRRIYFASNSFADGILEGINYYKFFERESIHD